jgi:two-component system alkaline phosphatase synthesis response regulator PhoP
MHYGGTREGEMSKKKGTILIVDDEQNIRLLVGNLLGRDYEVLEASNGVEALDLARRQKLDLILMDIMMPSMDGYSACHAIKNDGATSKIPVVMVTAVGQELNKMFATQMGADGYITKPFQLQDLLETIGRFL